MHSGRSIHRPYPVIQDEVLIEKTLLHLDIDDVKSLFMLFPQSRIKALWKEKMLSQEPMYHQLNRLYAFLFFNLKDPDRYIRNYVNNKHKIHPMHGLAKHTEKIFNRVSELSCLKPYTLIGGTALSLQLGMRESEDLDFCIWSKNLRIDKPTVDWPFIEKELGTIGAIAVRDVLGFDQVNFVVDGVKISFIAKQRNPSPVKSPVTILNNVIAADIISIGAMKVELILRRSDFRDYYDIYSILSMGCR
jgi:hypothetical protein